MDYKNLSSSEILSKMTWPIITAFLLGLGLVCTYYQRSIGTRPAWWDVPLDACMFLFFALDLIKLGTLRGVYLSKKEEGK